MGTSNELPFCLICQACHDEIHWLPQPIDQVMMTNKAGLAKSNQPPVASPHLHFNQSIPSSSNTDLTEFPRFTIQSAAPHSYFIRAAIIAFKYKEQINALPILIHAIRQLPRPQGCYANNSVILATPTTRSRLASRGFDPVAILAYYLSQHWNIPLWNGTSRVDNAVRQQGLDRVERQQNIHDAFRTSSRPPCHRVLIFDDVVTTGSTLAALAYTLKKAYPDTKISAYSISHGK